MTRDIPVPVIVDYENGYYVVRVGDSHHCWMARCHNTIHAALADANAVIKRLRTQSSYRGA